MTKAPIDRILNPLNKFIHQEYTGGIVLFLAVVIALIWSNTPGYELYHSIWETEISVGIDNWAFTRPFHTWINDGLMAIFFFVIGLELKREFISGELSTIKNASLPMIAALGGMIVPALIYTAFNYGQDSAMGWGIPMATDIAFALGLLSIAGRHIPDSVKVFLSALAVADDLGAVLVIAVFYTDDISFIPLAIAGLLLLMLWLGNMAGIRSTLFYLIVGIVIWYCFMLSGVHATIAGVLVAFMIPARTKVNEAEYIKHLHQYAGEFEQAIPLAGSLTTPEQHHTIEKIKQISLDAETPLQKIETSLHPWVAFIIMPLFALSNAGIPMEGNLWQAMSNPVSLGVLSGLVAGKFVGIMLFIWIALKLKLTALPQHSGWKHIAGVAMLAGVGFTMSLFISELAFDAESLIVNAKYGILFASLLSGISGLLILRSLKPAKR